MLISVRGLEFEVFVGGPENGTPIVLLHGFPQNSRQWEPILPTLHAAGLKSVAINQRGYSPGARPAEPAEYALPECTADVVSIMEVLGHPKFHLVGHDWGGAVAWALAAGAPERVLSLTAVSTPHPQAITKAIRDGNSDQRARSAYFFVFGDLANSVPAMLADDAAMLRRLFTGSGMSDEHLERYVGPLRDPAAMRGALIWYTAAIKRMSPAVGPVGVPTTFVWSNGDIALGRAAAEGTADFVTGDYRFVELDGISHWIPDQAPEQTAQAILDRVAGLA